LTFLAPFIHHKDICTKYGSTVETCCTWKVKG